MKKSEFLKYIEKELYWAFDDPRDIGCMVAALERSGMLKEWESESFLKMRCRDEEE